MAGQVHRMGGFAAYNTGEIVDCYSNVKLHLKDVSAGFCGENKGILKNCYSKGAISKKAKEKAAGFCAKQSGTMENCFWVCKDKKEQGAEFWSDWDEAVLPDEASEKIEEILSGWDQTGTWNLVRDAEGHFADLSLYNVSSEIRKFNHYIEIPDAKKLEEVAADINNGSADPDTLYRLTADIDMGGHIWSPMGVDQNTPFSGCFDGAGHTVKNFKIRANQQAYSGFFGYIGKQGEVHNLKVDCVITGRGDYAGSLSAANEGLIVNCISNIHNSLSRYTGNFVAQNTGRIVRSCTMGKVSPLLLIPWWLPALILALLFTAPPVAFYYSATSAASEVFAPIIMDPNAKPIPPEEQPVAPPKEEVSESSATFIMNASMEVSTENYVGFMGLKCPPWSNKGFVATAYVTAADLQKNGASYTQDAVIYQSGLIAPELGIENVQLQSLPDGSRLPAGEYQFIVQFDFYDPETNEKSAVNTTAPIDVLIH